MGVARVPTLLALALVVACGESRTAAPSSVAAAPASVSAIPATSATGAADPLRARVAQLQAELGAEFAFRVDPPFVIAGDSAPARLAEQVEMFQWALRMLQQQFFERRPKALVDVFLFRDKQSYEAHTQALFHEAPQSPYGYFLADKAALIMNIGTGGGTLVHELVHALMVENFPACPPWFNEGMGALFERPGELDGKIQGFPNWRQPILQAAIREKRTIPLSALFHLDGGAFYGTGYEVHYAEARYLLYWAQLHGQLEPLYREMLSHRAEDPTGEAAVKRVLGEPDLSAFQRRWERWALALPAPD